MKNKKILEYFQENIIEKTINLSLPIILFLFSLISFILFFYEVRKKRIFWKTLISWIVWNTIFTIFTFYLLIVVSLNVAGFNFPNIFNQIAYYVFGLDFEGDKQWIILLILTFISILLFKTLKNSIKISKLELRIDELNKQIAILMGQINRTTDFEKLPLALKEKSLREIRNELKQKIKIRREKIKANEKLQSLENKYKIKKDE